jgi:hypothetical protein
MILPVWNCDNANKQAAPKINQKKLPTYKSAFIIDFENFSFHISADTIRNVVETGTDSVDVLMRDFDIYSHFYDSTDQDYITNSKVETFSHYYIKKYCLDKDTFKLCNESISDTYSYPLIVEISEGSSREYTSPENFSSFPVETTLDTTEKLPGYQFTPAQLAEVNSFNNDQIMKILDDKLVDLNYDHISERILVYDLKDGNTYCAIFENRDNNWIPVQKINCYADCASIYTLQFSGMKTRSVLLKMYECSQVPRKRYFETDWLFVPAE